MPLLKDKWVGKKKEGKTSYWEPKQKSCQGDVNAIANQDHIRGGNRRWALVLKGKN